MFVLADRGPNPDPIKGKITLRPFALPAFQPRIVPFTVKSDGTITVGNQLLLTRPDGTPLTGRPNVASEKDEVPVDLKRKPLALDPWGADIEGIAVANDGTYWLSDEYGPSLYHVSSTGKILDRFVPEGYGGEHTKNLPAVFRQRKINRGFEGLAIQENLLFAFLQSPLQTPDSKGSRLARVLVFDIVRKRPVGQYAYLTEAGKERKVGDVAALPDGSFLVLEQDDKDPAWKKVFRVRVEGATNFDLIRESKGVGEPLEKLEAEGKLSQLGIRPLQKTLFVDLAESNFAPTKAEGLAVADGKTLFVVNDDDFGLEGSFDPETGKLKENPAREAEILLRLPIGDKLSEGNRVKE